MTDFVSIPEDMSKLERTIGYTFKNSDFLELALTHSSYSNEARAKGNECECNERMEFLGDSVLSFVVSEYLYKTCPELPEGDLSRIRSNTVCEKALCEFARRIKLGDYLKLGHGEARNDGKNRPSILADAFEALLAAIYLDSGIESVKTFLMPFAVPEIELQLRTGKLKDYKTALQQIVQQEHGECLRYITVAESGPAHKRVFEVEAHLNSNVIGRGKGYSKREAEQCAAKEALKLFGVE